MIDQVKIRSKLAGLEQGKNASLWLHKYMQDHNRNDNQSRSKLVKEVTEVPEPSEYVACFARWEKMLLRECGEQNMRRAQVKGRMIVGLGSESVLETAICLHHTYGVPYIPGSALKGLAASYAHQRLGEGWQQGEKYHTIVFGNTETAGYMTFFDALYFPGTGFKGRALYPDIITVHHQKYYQNAAQAPSDSDDPIPVPFLSATGQYLLVLAAPDLPMRWIDLTFQILAEALKHFGIGAKTSSGYGRMALLDQPVKSMHSETIVATGPSVDPEVIKARDAQSRLEALRESEVAGQINSYYQQWQKLTSQEARTLLAQAIIEKVRKAGREKASAEKSWYKELLASLTEK